MILAIANEVCPACLAQNAGREKGKTARAGVG
jgi:hypothetical protein